MPNGRVILLGILCVFFITSTALEQAQSDSHIIRVTKEIDIAELDEKVDDLDQSRQDLTQTLKNLDNSISNLNTNVEYLNVTVARLDERTEGIVGWQYAIFGMVGAIFATLVASIVFFFLTQGFLQSEKRNRDSTDSRPSASLRQIQDFAARVGYSGTPRSENGSSAEGQ